MSKNKSRGTMKKVLVCGAGGFIGSHLVKRLRNEGWESRFSLRKGIAQTCAWIESQVQNQLTSLDPGHAESS